MIYTAKGKRIDDRESLLMAKYSGRKRKALNAGLLQKKAIAGSSSFMYILLSFPSEHCVYYTYLYSLYKYVLDLCRLSLVMHHNHNHMMT